MRNEQNIDVLVVCSVGGHLTQLLALSGAYVHLNYHFVVNDRCDLAEIMVSNTSVITHADRNLKQIKNWYEAFSILKRLKPRVILSNGASPGVVFGFIGKYFFGCKYIFLESYSRVKTPSLSARLSYIFADSFYVQWPGLSKRFKRAEYKGQAL